MKPLLIFIVLFASALYIDIEPVSLDAIRKDSITVTVRGEVDREGELELPLYSTVSDALEAAGVSESGDTGDMNPLTVLKDHDVITVREKDETGPAKVSINFSGLEELCTLPGIGEATAEKIIRYRDENGLFRSVDELTLVNGVGKAKLEKILDRITL